MPRRSFSGSYPAKMRSAGQAPLCLNRLPRVVDCSAGPSAGENRCAQAGGANWSSRTLRTGSRSRSKSGITPSLDIANQELRAVAGAA